MSREVALERELNEATEKINKLKTEKEQLDTSVQVLRGCFFALHCVFANYKYHCCHTSQELQRRLTEMETTATATSARRQSVMSIVDGSVHSRDTGESRSRGIISKINHYIMPRTHVTIVTGGSGSNARSMEAALRRGEREKQMEMLVCTSLNDILMHRMSSNCTLGCFLLQLQKAKREKDKAIRIIVQLVGKVRHN